MHKEIDTLRHCLRDDWSSTSKNSCGAGRGSTQFQSIRIILPICHCVDRQISLIVSATLESQNQRIHSFWQECSQISEFPFPGRNEIKSNATCHVYDENRFDCGTSCLENFGTKFRFSHINVSLTTLSRRRYFAVNINSLVLNWTSSLSSRIYRTEHRLSLQGSFDRNNNLCRRNFVLCPWNSDNLSSSSLPHISSLLGRIAKKARSVSSISALWAEMIARQPSFSSNTTIGILFVDTNYLSLRSPWRVLQTSSHSESKPQFQWCSPIRTLRQTAFCRRKPLPATCDWTSAFFFSFLSASRFLAILLQSYAFLTTT